MKVYIACTCHPTCFIQHASPFILSFDVKCKMITDMKPIVSLSFQSFLSLPSFSVSSTFLFLCFLFIYTFFGLLAWPSLYSSPFCSCNLGSWSSYTTFLHAVWFFLFFCNFWVLLNRSNISSNMAFLSCCMKCWIGLTRP